MRKYSWTFRDGKWYRVKMSQCLQVNLIKLKGSVGLGGRSNGRLLAQHAWSLGLDSKDHTNLTWKHIIEMLTRGGTKIRSSVFKASLAYERCFLKKKKRTVINDGCDVWKFSVTDSFLCLCFLCLLLFLLFPLTLENIHSKALQSVFFQVSVLRESLTPLEFHVLCGWNKADNTNFTCLEELFCLKHSFSF